MGDSSSATPQAEDWSSELSKTDSLFADSELRKAIAGIAAGFRLSTETVSILRSRMTKIFRSF